MAFWTKTICLLSPLGRWRQPGLLLQQDWPAYFGYEDYLLYARTFNRYTKPTDWVATSTCITAIATTNDGAHTWQSEGCSGIVDSLDDWENKLLQDVQIMKPIHMIMENIQQSSFLVATDGSSGMDSISFRWKITAKTDLDWDTTAQIVPILDKSNIHEEFRHVKSNQDKNKIYKELSLPV
eukprot:7376250-Ditylum_brightwellii.AAC.1